MIRPDRTLMRLWRRLWPQVPLGLFLIGAGAANIIAGTQAPGFARLENQTLPQFGQRLALGALGSGAEIVLGALLVGAGIGLFWRVRVAWVMAVLLVTVTIVVSTFRHNYGSALLIPGLVLIALVATRHYFWRRTLLGNSLVTVTGVAAVLAYGTFGIYLLGDSFEPKIHSLVTALYFTIETLSTVGYGDYHAANTAAQGFIITLIVFGLSVFATAVFSVLGPAMAARLERMFTAQSNRMMEKDHVILVGEGVIARNTAHELAHRGIPFVQLVGPDETPPLPEKPVVRGDATDDKVLHQAGIHKARMLIAAEEEDGENAFISLAAKDTRPDLHVLVIASSGRSIRRLRLARADMVFAPAEVGSRLLANLIEGEELPEQFSDLLKRGEA